MADINAVQCKLDKVVQFLKPVLSLANCHMVNFFTGNYWETLLSLEIRKEYEEIGLPGVYKMFQNCSKLKNEINDPEISTILNQNSVLNHYFSMASKMYLVATPNICLSHNQFQEKLKSWNYNQNTEFNVSGFMSPKKNHEVKMMSCVVAAISNVSNSTHIIDVGSGRGYLSSMLALLHGLRVLGIDSSHINTHSAVKRSEKLQKYWPGLCRRAAESCKTDIPTKRGKHWKSKSSSTSTLSPKSDSTSNDTIGATKNPHQLSESLYRQTTMHINENSNLLNIIRENFPEDALYSNLSLVGLHTCGNLAATCLKLFSQNENIKALCNVGCCYHLLEEHFAANPFESESNDGIKEFGFPLSKFLITQDFGLGRNARMLAAQAIDRLTEKKEVSIDALFFRALLQVILFDKLGEDRSDWQVGRIAAKCHNFMEYCQKSLKKLNLEIELKEEEISAYYDKYIEQKNKLEAFFLFRVTLAPIIETIIILDRLLYLLEQGIKEVHIVQLFDPVVSPRCNAIVAFKNIEEDCL